MAINIGAEFLLKAKVEGQQQLDSLNETIQQTAKSATDMGTKSAEASEKSAKKFKELGKAGEISAKQYTNAMRMLPVQATDAFVQISGGQSPFLAILQQGAQVKDSFGGMIPMFRAFAGALGPIGIAAIAVAAALGAIVTPIIAGYMEQKEFQRQLLITGNYAGMTAAKFDDLAKSISKSSGITIGNSKDLLGGAVGSGAFGVTSIESAARAMANVQRLSGQTADEVVKDFAGMSRGVAAWAAEHNRTYNFLTLDTYKHIQALENQGRVEEAMKLVSDELNKSLAGRREDLGYLETAWKNVKETASAAWDAMKGWGKEKTTSDVIEEKRKEVLALQDEFAKLQKMGKPETTTWGVSLKDKRAQYDARLSELPNLIKQKTDEILLVKSMEKAKQDEATRIAQEAAEARAKIEREEKDRAIANAMGGQKLAAVRLANQRELNLVAEHEADLENEYAKGFLSEAQYAQRKLDIKQEELKAQEKLLRQEIAIVSQRQTRPGDAQDEIQKRTEIIGLEQQLVAVRGKLLNMPMERLTQQHRDERKALEEKAKAWAEVVKGAQDYVRTLSMSTRRSRIELDEVSPLAKARQLAALDVEEIKRNAEEKLRELNKVLNSSVTEGARDEVLRQIQAVKDAAEEAIDVATKKAVPEDAWKGARRAMAEYVDDAKNAGKQIQQFMTSAFSKIEDTMVEGFMTGKFAFKDMARSIIQDLIRITVRALILKPIMESIGGMMGGGGFGGGFGILSLFGFAKGGAFGAGRDVVSSPTLFKFANGGSFKAGVMGEAGPEAIMPLKRGPDGRLGVQASGSGSGSGQVNVSVVVNASSSQVGGDAQGGQLGQMIANAVSAVIIKEKRPGGMLSPV